VISVLGMFTAFGVFWVIRGVPLWSAPGLMIYVIGMVPFLWSALYLIGEIESWRKRTH
jgi:hypothetical protein